MMNRINFQREADGMSESSGGGGEHEIKSVKEVTKHKNPAVNAWIQSKVQAALKNGRRVFVDTNGIPRIGRGER